jgi:beta-phosphoglucomutase-like phosphatase (HAD superfamily)
MQDKYILFDFDGVIVDSYQTAFEVNQLICPSISDAEYRRRFEGNINDWNNDQTKHGANCRHDLDFFELYVPKMNDGVRLVPGMGEVVAKLANEYKLIIISSTISAPISELLEK